MTTQEGKTAIMWLGWFGVVRGAEVMQLIAIPSLGTCFLEALKRASSGV